MSVIDIKPLIQRVRMSFSDVEKKISDPSVFDDRKNYEKLSKEYQRLSSLIGRVDESKKYEKELADNQSMLADESDDDFKEVIRTEIESLESKISKLNAKILTLIIPPDENDSRNTIVEIRPAAGGDEAALFAGDLLRFYLKFAEKNNWKSEILYLSERSLGGIKDVSFSLTGSNVFRYMKFESGVHRVQRIPTTESSGRIHTSTVTVAILPEAKEVDIQINSEDLKIDVFRSSGPGGQSVNTTDSAVRVTHIPTNISVASQQEKSQHRNKEIAMRILRSRILEMKQQEEMEKHAKERKTQVGTGDRSERIRTYNYPQNRVTDHRFGISNFNLPEIMEGDFEGFLEQIMAADSAIKLEAELAK